MPILVNQVPGADSLLPLAVFALKLKKLVQSYFAAYSNVNLFRLTHVSVVMAIALPLSYPGTFTPEIGIEPTPISLRSMGLDLTFRGLPLV